VKKLILLCTMICASELYGMEPQTMGAFASLPEELHKEIVNALVKSNDLGQVIEAIQLASTLRGLRYDKLQDFTKLVHVLAKKFNTGTREIASEFETPIAKTYLDLIKKLFDAFNDMDNDAVANVIKDGADINFTTNTTKLNGVPMRLTKVTTPILQCAIKQALDNFGVVLSWNEDIALIKLLIDSGAKQESAEYYARYYLFPYGIIKTENEEATNNQIEAYAKYIKKLLEEAKK